MIILALDTTTRGGSVAVADDNRMLTVLAGDESRTHGERLPGEIARALVQAGITREQIDLLAVATGPGAFTGLRIGLAAMQGLAMTLNKPVLGVSALDALAAQGEPLGADLIVPWMDAARGEVFAALIDAKTHANLEAPTVAEPQALLDVWRPHLVDRHVAFIGAREPHHLRLIGNTAGDGVRETRWAKPLAPDIAIIAASRKDEAGPPHQLEPLYVRRPDAEIERDRRSQS